MVASSQLMSLPLCQIFSVFWIAMRTPCVLIIAEEKALSDQLFSLPYGFDGLGAADLLIGSDQWNAFDDGRGPDYAVGRIFRVANRKPYGNGGNLRCHRLQDDARDRLSNERLHTAQNLDASALCQPCQFPESDGCHCDPRVLARVTDGLARLRGEPLGVAGHPNQNVGIEQDHLLSQSSSGVTGPTM